jgi:hypothetical protein
MASTMAPTFTGRGFTMPGALAVKALAFERSLRDGVTPLRPAFP